MAIHTILGGTGSTGSAVIRALLKNQKDQDRNEDEIRIFVRSKAKLLALLPQLESTAHVTIVEGALSSQAALSAALRKTTCIYSCIAANHSEPGMSIALDTAASIISALKTLRAATPPTDQYRRPTVLVLSSASLNANFPHPPAVITTALHYLYADLRRAEALYSDCGENDPGLLEAIFAHPPATMPGTEPTGHALSTDGGNLTSMAVVSFADLGAGMVEMAARREELAWKGVMVRATGQVVADWRPNIRYLAMGLFAYYLPSIWGLGRKWSLW